MGCMFLFPSVVVLFFFFFQAEDGIRDGRVTGVQTCALPIFAAALQGPRVTTTYLGAHVVPADRGRSDYVEEVVATVPRRSEERRVGKECRSRWSPYQ